MLSGREVLHSLLKLEKYCLLHLYFRVNCFYTFSFQNEVETGLIFILVQ